MPLRDYKCVGCGYLMKDILRYSYDGSIVRCPECGSDMNQLLSTFEPRFIGPGWETNDHKPKPESQH